MITEQDTRRLSVRIATLEAMIEALVANEMARSDNPSERLEDYRKIVSIMLSRLHSAHLEDELLETLEERLKHARKHLQLAGRL